MAKKRAPRREQEYKKDSLPEKTISNRVEMWRLRIEQAREHLHLADRIGLAEDANVYLCGGKEVPGKGRAEKRARIYINYSLPLLREQHRGSIPEIPTPVVEARTKAAAVKQATTQQFLNYLFEKHAPVLEKVIDDGQWDDNTMGVTIFRADWSMQSVDANPISEMSQENVDVQRARAEAESTGQDKLGNPADPVIATSDLDIIHIEIHDGYLQSLDPVSPEHSELAQHVELHRARLTTITEEDVRVERVSPYNYIFDDSAGWRKRGWECEIKSVRVKYLIDNGYKNVFPANVPPINTSASIPYEDKLVRIGEIHDRLNGKEYVIPMDGSGDLFLMDRPWRYGNLDIYYLDVFNPYHPDQSWGVPAMITLKPILDELAKVDYYIQRHVANHPTPKILVPKGPGTGDIKKGMKDPSQMILEVPQEQAAGINIFSPPPIPATLTEWRNSLLNELRRVVGLDAQQTGQSNPHQVSATETYTRAVEGADRVSDRQKVITKFLSWLGGMFLGLYKNHAEKAVEVKINVGQGPEWTLIQPEDLMLDIDISFFIEALTDKGRAENILLVREVNTYLRQSQAPVDYDLLDVWSLRKLGLRRPAQFRIAGPLSPDNVEQVGGQPGVAGGGEPPVGTQQNTDANKARFGGGAEALAETQQTS